MPIPAERHHRPASVRNLWRDLPRVALASRRHATHDGACRVTRPGFPSSRGSDYAALSPARPSLVRGILVRIA